MLTTIRESWGWTGLDPAAVAATNAFGEVLVRSTDGAYWRICPAALSCEIVAADDAGFDALWTSEAFQFDWQMKRPVDLALGTLGPVDDEHCYCLKMPAALGGLYDTANFGTITRRELLAFTGDVAEQIKDLPDGTRVELDCTDPTK